MTAEGAQGTVWVCPSCGEQTDRYSNLCEHCRYVHMGRLRPAVSPEEVEEVPEPPPTGLSSNQGQPRPPSVRSNHGLACPFCRTHSARITTEGYSQDRGVPAHDAKALGLWRTRTVGVCDRCGESWGLSSKGAPIPCPSCGSNDSGRFGYVVQRNCWVCGEVWKSPPPPQEKTRLDRLGEAIAATAALGFLIFMGGIGLFWIGVGVVFLYFAPVLLVPLGLIALVVAFFYFTSRPRTEEKSTESLAWLSEFPGDEETADRRGGGG